MAKPLVLIIEDDPKLATVYQMVLRQVGFDTVLDATGNQYADVLSAMPPALIILDLHLPFASGMDILNRLRNDPRLVNIPVLVTTADVILARSVESKASEVLLKPVGVNRLRETVLRLYPKNT